jgi:protein-S-isoprenylcysteine O-methyltransferase Ste14
MELTSLALYLCAVLGAIGLGTGLLGYLRRHPLVVAYLLLYAGFDLVDRLARPAFDAQAERDRSPACRLNAALMLVLFAAAPFERTFLLGGDPPALCSAIGLFVELAGLSLALAARIQLGRYGTPHLTLLPDQTLVSTGLYRRIRHPIYAGGILSRQAWSILWGAPIVLGVGAIADLILISWRIRIEEAIMVEGFGQLYDSYRAKTERLIPLVW